jgi:hypothetical protein
MGELLRTMPTDALGMVELGPLPLDGHDWYVIQYTFLNASGVTEGGQGWVASGPSESPWLVPAQEAGWYSGLVAGYAGSGSALLGPVEIRDPFPHGLRWAAVGDHCGLRIALGDEEIVSTTIDRFASGEWPTTFFIDQPALIGMVTITVEGECAWAVSVVFYQG